MPRAPNQTSAATAPREGCLHVTPATFYPVGARNECMSVVLEQLVSDTVALLEAVSRGDVEGAWRSANQLKNMAWEQAMPGLASAAGAFQQSLEWGPKSEAEMSLAVQTVAFEMQSVVRERNG